MLGISSVFLPAVFMFKVPILECALGIPPLGLYRNVQGKRVVCDLEGKGNLNCLGSVPEDLLLRTEPSVEMTTESTALDWGWMAVRNIPDNSGCSSSITSSSDGFGWVTASDCLLELNNDSRRVSIAPNFGNLTLPFWNGFTSDRPLPYSSFAAERLLLADFCPSDRQAADQHRFAVERASQVEKLEATNGRGEFISGLVFSHLNRASWDVTIPENGRILIIERTFDAFHGLQRARVFFDNEFVGWWHCIIQDRVNRWATDSCHLRLEHNHRGRKIRVTLDPPAGVPLFSLGCLRVFGLCQ